MALARYKAADRQEIASSATGARAAGRFGDARVTTVTVAGCRVSDDVNRLRTVSLGTTIRARCGRMRRSIAAKASRSAWGNCGSEDIWVMHQADDAGRLQVLFQAVEGVEAKAVDHRSRAGGLLSMSLPQGRGRRACHCIGHGVCARNRDDRHVMAEAAEFGSQLCVEDDGACRRREIARHEKRHAHGATWGVAIRESVTAIRP